MTQSRPSLETQSLLDLPHHTYERLPRGGAFIRKGSVELREGDISIIPTHMAGDAVLERATSRVAGELDSMSHGTGRKMARRDGKPLAEDFDFTALRKAILIPEDVEDGSLRTERPYAYRDLDECLALLDGYVDEVARFAAVAYRGYI